MATDFRGRFAIVGVGQAPDPIGKSPQFSSLGLLTMAMKNAIEDSGIPKSEIDGMVSRGVDNLHTHHQHIGRMLGLNTSFSTSLDNGGASQALAVALACMAIDAGLCHTVVTGYGRDTWSRTRASEDRMRVTMVPEHLNAREFGPEFGRYGAVPDYAYGASRHMHLYGTTKEQLGSIAVAFREHATRNPHAQMQEPITMEDYLNARWIVEPLNLFDCSLVSDGAGAVVVTSAERAKDLPHDPAYILGFGSHNNLRGWTFDDHMINTAAQESAQAAYRMAGVGPEDIDTAQLYDCFTYMVMAELEDYGFCKKGEGGPFAESGVLRLDGSLPTNTSGGQLSEGHVEGMLQILEGVRQLRHEYPPERQVAGAEVALVSGHGGMTVCHTTLILGRST